MSEEQVRAVLGGVFVAVSVLYLVSTVRRMVARH
jgi:hypothetical protein